MNIIAICNKCNNGTRINRADRTLRCDTCDRNTPPRKSSDSNGSLGKRSSATQTETLETPLAKQARHSNTVTNTVATIMDGWFKEENDLLTEDLQQKEGRINTLELALDTKNKDIRKKDAKITLLELQLQAALRYSQMVEQWCPQVQEMFSGDRDDMIAIQGVQNLQLQSLFEAIDEDNGQETEEEVEV